MIRNSEELATKKLSNYSFLFIGCGNTFKLLKELKTSNAYQHIVNYLEHDGIIFGGSAQAIIFGQDISVFCHYTNGTPDKNEQSKQFLLEMSKQNKIIALPEEVTLFVNDNTIEVIGDKPYYYFENGIMYEKGN